MAATPPDFTSWVQRGLQHWANRVQATEAAVLRLEGQVQVLATQQAAPRRPRQPDMGRPQVFRGDTAHSEADFENWSFKLEAMVGAVDEGVAKAMLQARCSKTPVPLPTCDVERNRATTLYYQLVMLTDGIPTTLVRQTGLHNGLEAYRLLHARYAPKTLGRGLGKLTSILRYEFGDDAGQLLDKMAEWEQLIDDYNSTCAAADRVTDATPCAVMQASAPPALRTHLLLNEPTQSTGSRRGG